MLDKKAWLVISSSSQRCWMELRSGLCVGQSSSSTINLSNHVFMDFGNRKGNRNRKGPSPNCVQRVESMVLSKMFWYAEALRLLFTGSKGPSPNLEKQRPPLSLLHSCHNVVRQVMFSWHVPNPDLSN